MKNRVYVGDMVQGKYKTQSYVQVGLPKSEWVITEDTHEGIVSRELFAMVQIAYSGDGKPRKANTGDNIFLRKIFCGHCGHAMRRAKYKNAHGFKCTTRNDYSLDDCKLVSINEDTLKAILLETLRVKAAVFTDASKAKTEKPVDNTELRSVQAELERYRHLIIGLYESLVIGDITEADYKDYKHSYEAKIATLTEREAGLRKSAQLLALEAAKLSKAADSFGIVHRITDLTVEVMDALVKKILVFEDKRVEIHLKFTDEIISIGGADNE